jgi:radical SAM superfamily enzyme YgiQ (UPF0313 family)
MEQHGYSVTCFDFNTDPELWGMHHKYFSIIQSLEDVSINDGYSKLWWILNAHLLAYANGADALALARVLEIVIPLYGIRHDKEVIDALIPIVDKYFKRLAEVTEHIDLTEYGVVGTSTYTTSLASSLFLLKRMKESNPQLLTVMGGGIFADDLALGSDNLDTLVADFPFVDHVILGEGELLFLNLIEGTLAHKRVITLGDLKNSTLDMKDVPIPDFSDLDLENYYHLSIEGARSCPFQCSFCSETIQWGDYRKKPMDLFADQVIELSQTFKMKEFFMGDSLMNPYINPFALELIEKKAGVLYDGYLRADKPVTNRKFVKLWADSGLFRVRLGIESAAKHVLDIMDKMTTPQVISDVLKTLASAGIRTTTYWIVGFPGETEQDFKETCDFIKEHHQYIYELEAHPYYYYPYGQVGSRFHQCSSLYPQEVTNHTKFQVWEIINANPTREVRYERLRRLAKICADLGLVNIYSMPERYQAEDRWHRLHPLAVEVYQSGRIDRKATTLSHSAIELSPDAGTVSIESKFADEDSVICYQASISKVLNEKKLAAALIELINYNEMLQITLGAEKQETAGETNGDVDTIDGAKLLAVYPLEQTNEESLATAKARAIAELAKDMRPTRSASVRVALFTSKASVELLLLVHRGVADARSASLLFEDLFRIYEQLSNNRTISLRPIPTAYTALMTSLGDLPNGISSDSDTSWRQTKVTSDQSVIGEQEVKGAVINIDSSRLARMSTKMMQNDGIHPSDIIACAVLETLLKVKEAENFDYDLRMDSRRVDEKLRYTVGPLTRTFPLPPLSPAGGHLRSRLQEIHRVINGALSSLHRNAASPLLESSPSGERISLNLEYCTETPWLGQDQWKPRGFLAAAGSLTTAYNLEVIPVATGNGLEVHLKYRNGAATIVLVKVLLDQLVTEIDLVLQDCESYAAAREYLSEEFATALPPSSFFAGIDVQEPVALKQTTFTCALDRFALRNLSSQCRIDLSTIILAAYSIVLSRLNGSEDVPLISSANESRAAGFVPLRLALSWTTGFREFAQQIERKIGLAQHHGADLFDILTNSSPFWESHSRPAFGAAYFFNDECEPQEHATVKTPVLPALLAGGFKLILEVTLGSSDLAWNFSYDSSRFTADEIERLGSSLSSVLTRVAADMNMSLEDASLNRIEKLLLETPLSIKELEGSFSFQT